MLGSALPAHPIVSTTACGDSTLVARRQLVLISGWICSVLASGGGGVSFCLALRRDDASENAVSAASLQRLKAEVDQLEHQLAAIGDAEFLPQ